MSSFGHQARTLGRNMSDDRDGEVASAIYKIERWEFLSAERYGDMSRVQFMHVWMKM